MVGFCNTWQINVDKKYLDNSLKSWAFIKKHINDEINGERLWAVNEDYSPMIGEEKAGFWKYPYHNSRTCIEIIKRIKSLNN